MLQGGTCMRERREIDGRAGLETRDFLPVDKQVMTLWGENGGGEANRWVVFSFTHSRLNLLITAIRTMRNRA